MQTRCIISFTGTQASFKVGNTGCRVKLNSGGICNDQVERINWLLLHTMRWLRGGGGECWKGCGGDIKNAIKDRYKPYLEFIKKYTNICFIIHTYIHTYTHTHTPTYMYIHHNYFDKSGTYK